MPQVSLVFHTYDVIASPADDAETVIALIEGVDTIWPTAPINLHGWVAINLDSDAVGVGLRVRRGSLTGAVVGPDPAVAGADPATASNALVSIDVVDLPGDTAAATYVLTATCPSASGESTVSAVHLAAQV